MKKYYYYLIISLLCIYSCKDNVLDTQIQSGGHSLSVYLNTDASLKTLQLSNKIGNSSKIYIGNVGGKKSFGIFKINSDVVSNNNDICFNEDIDTISINLKLGYQSLYSLNQATLVFGDSLLSNQGQNNISVDHSNANQVSSNNQLNAYLVLQSDIDKIWTENLSFDYNEDSNFFIYGSDSLDIDSLKLNALPVQIGASEIAINLDSLMLNGNYMLDFLCSSDDESSLIILLDYVGDNNLVVASSNNPYSQPYLNFSYKERINSFTPYSKIEILDMELLHGIDSIYIQQDADSDEFGTILGFASILDTNSIIDSDFLNTKVDLFNIIISPVSHENDSSNTIDFFLDNIHLVYRNYDPSGDNFDSLLNIDGSENNELWDYGEYFYDCGSDGICSPDEEGYNLFGTENNGVYDFGEPFLDYGANGIQDSLDLNNPDPNGDNYDEDLNPIGTENNNICDLGEIFLDYGIDGIPDSLEGVNYLYDNYDPINNPNGTEKNNLWDLGEWFYDTGIDSLWSFEEEGYNIGTEANGVYDIGETYYDYGIDGLPDSLEIDNIYHDNYNKDPNNDDWNDCGIDRCCDPYEDGNDGCLENINNDFIDGVDLNGDNYSVDNNIYGTENNGIYDLGEKWEGNNFIDWYDQNNDSLFSISERDSGEVWFDWGIDQIENKLEPYYGSFPLLYSVGLNDYSINYNVNNLDTTFFQPDTTGDFDAKLWISRIKKDDNGNLVLTCSMNTAKELAAIQFKLNHQRYFKADTVWNENSTNVNYVNSLKVIEDLSVYQQNKKELNDSIYVNYSESYSAIIDFPDLRVFIDENPNAIISNALLTLYPDTLISNDNDYFKLYLNRIVDEYVGEDYIDSLDNQYILDYPYYYSYLSAPDSIQFNIKRYIQKLVSNEYQYNGLMLSTDGLGENFDYFYFKNIDQNPAKIEVMYTK